MSNLTDFIGGSGSGDYTIVDKNLVDYTKDIELLSDTVIKQNLCKVASFKSYGINGVRSTAWEQKASGATARHAQSAVHYNNGIDDIMIVFGGVDNNNNNLNDTWEYNITKDSWTQKTGGGTARYDHTAIHYNNGTDDIMIVFGGYDSSNNLNDTWEYNITKDSWTQKTSGATARHAQSAVHYNNGIDDIMIVFGGYDSNYNNTTWEYNITKDSWTQKTSGATARYNHTAIHYNNGTDDIMIVFGGVYNSSYLSDTWEYNITKDSWTQKTSGATARYCHTAIHYNNGTDDIMIVFGGEYNSSYLNDTWEYNITKDSWTQKTSGATARYDQSAIHYNNGTDDIMIVFGGWNGSAYYNDTWAYDIQVDNFSLANTIVSNIKGVK